MEITKLKKLMDKYNLSNFIKVIIILIVLFLIARLFIPSIDSTNPMKLIEGFQALGYSHYGNQLSLQDPTNTPKYSGNTCTFKFDGVYRIEAIQLYLNANPNVSTISSPIKAFRDNNSVIIYIQYEDGNGNLKYIQASGTNSPPNFNNTTNLSTITNSNNIQQSMISVSNITDENNLVVYTSKIIITIGDTTNLIDSYIDSCNIGFISNFAFWGSTRDMISRKDFENLSATLNLNAFASGNATYDSTTNADTNIFTTTTDILLYGISIIYSINSVNPPSGTPVAPPASNTSTCTNASSSPFKLSILYNNGLYAGNNFNINVPYVIRNDPLCIASITNTDYILFTQPIIANKLVITMPRVNITTGQDAGKQMKLILTTLQGYGTTPTTTNIADYKRTINALLSASSKGQNLDTCPSIDDLVMKQGQTQQICDNLEYQDKVKSEKLRLERNKQYLLKLQKQQQQIDQLNQVIHTLDGKRQERNQTADMARVLQYQQQKATANTIRDLANQRLQSQDNNKLYLDVNINS